MLTKMDIKKVKGLRYDSLCNYCSHCKVYQTGAYYHSCLKMGLSRGMKAMQNCCEFKFKNCEYKVVFDDLRKIDRENFDWCEQIQMINTAYGLNEDEARDLRKCVDNFDESFTV